MAVKCILTGQTPSVLDGVTENVQSQIDNKVDKVTGKGLSTEDYTSAEKTKLGGIEKGAQKNTVTSVAGKTGEVTLAANDVGAQPKITVNGILKGDGEGTVTAAQETEVELVDITPDSIGAQSKITANGLLKGDGNGDVGAAIEGIDYVSPQNVLTKDNIAEYVPSKDYHPATKKYVDSKAGASSTLRVGTLSIPTSGWIGEGPYTQAVTIPDGNSSTKVDIQVDDNVIQQMIDDNVSALYISNTNGVFTIHAVGEKPSVDLIIQISCSEANIIQI